jgi:hypothetical protein
MHSLNFRSMPGPARIALSAAITAALMAFSALALAPAAHSASALTIYKNDLRSSDGRGEIRQLGGKANCRRGGSSTAFRIKVGKKTRDCYYLIPVVGRDLQVAATARVFKSTPKDVRPKAFAAVNLRQGSNGTRYQLAVYPSGNRYKVRKVSGDGKVRILASGKAGSVIKGFGQPNRLTLRAFNDVKGQPAGSARLLAIVNGKRLAVINDREGGKLESRNSTFSIGADRNATGASGSFVNLKLGVPDPF